MEEQTRIKICGLTRLEDIDACLLYTSDAADEL